jgi:hypothetical protein
MSWREDLELFGIRLPDGLPVDQWAASLAGSPCKNTLALVGLSSLLFYAAEKHRNASVQSIWDALLYCSTCVSVGYADIHPRTPTGKILGSALMTIGPALAARTLDGPAAPQGTDAAAVQRQILQTLQQILDQLQVQPQATNGLVRR